jgi:hypothetical protein
LHDTYSLIFMKGLSDLTSSPLLTEAFKLAVLIISELFVEDTNECEDEELEDDDGDDETLEILLLKLLTTCSCRMLNVAKCNIISYFNSVP